MLSDPCASVRMGGLTTTSEVFYNASSPWRWVQRNTRACTVTVLGLSLPMVSDELWADTGRSIVTGETRNDWAFSSPVAERATVAATATSLTRHILETSVGKSDYNHVAIDARCSRRRTGQAAVDSDRIRSGRCRSRNLSSVCCVTPFIGSVVNEEVVREQGRAASDFQVAGRDVTRGSGILAGVSVNVVGVSCAEDGNVAEGRFGCEGSSGDDAWKCDAADARY